MPPSMRAQTLANKARLKHRKDQRDRRKKLLSLICEGESALKASQSVGVSRTTAYRIKSAHTRGDKQLIEKLLNPEQYHAGCKPVLSPSEENLIVQRALYAAEHGFAVDNSVISTVHAKIAADRASNYSNGIPSSDTIRAFRARNRSLAYRVAENVSNARLAAQNQEHVSSLVRVLKKVERDHPELFEDPRRIWNWDETAVSGEYGRKIRCYASSTTHSGGARRSIRDAGKHVTAGIAVAACGNIAPLFLIASGKRVVKTWKDPLNPNDFSHSNGVPHWLCHEGWFRSETALHVTKCGSVDKQIIVDIVKHINGHARKTIDSSKHILLLLDGHSSRNGTEWLEACNEMKIIVVRLPANTTHILQPCDKFVNSRFQKNVRRTRDELLSMSHLSWANTAYKIKLAVAGFQAITADDARRSFVQCGLWPMDYRFLQLVPPRNTVSASTVYSRNAGTNNQIHGSNNCLNLTERSMSMQLQRKIYKLTDGSVPASRSLAEVAALLHSEYRVHSILATEIKAPNTANVTRQSQKRGGVVQGAAELTLRASRSNLQSLSDSNASKNQLPSSRFQGDLSTDHNGGDKENLEPSAEVGIPRNLEDIFNDSLDDIPIQRWRDIIPSLFGNGQQSAGDIQLQSAARSLASLSQMR